jgi:hypothetical protein
VQAPKQHFQHVILDLPVVYLKIPQNVRPHSTELNEDNKYGIRKDIKRNDSCLNFRYYPTTAWGK